MQVTLEIPDELASRLAPEQEHLAEIIKRGLRKDWSAGSALAREVVSFLAGDPQAEEILAFQPSESAAERVRELLDKNRDGTLTPDEEAEMDEIEAFDNFMAILKARACRMARPAA